jgi:hypothetical protein
MDPGSLHAAGIELPLTGTPAGPLIDAAASGELEPLAWVVNGGFSGVWSNLREQLARGDDVRSGGPYARRPTELDDDVSEAGERWRRHGGSPPDGDGLLVGTSWEDKRLLVPRAALLDLIDALAAARSQAKRV